MYSNIITSKLVVQIKICMVFWATKVIQSHFQRIIEMKKFLKNCGSFLENDIIINTELS